MGRGVETWHPAPEFYYKLGGGPLFDMGPYYITALVNSLGAVKRVAAITNRGFDQREIRSQPKAGEIIDVEVDIHTSGVLEFHNGAIVTVVMSFDVWAHTNQNIEIHGTEASLSAPDPNGFRGEVKLSTNHHHWESIELTHGYTGNMRNIGLADMCTAVRTGRPFRANGNLAFHVLEVMSAFDASSKTAEHIEIGSAPEQPSPLPTGLHEGELD